MNMKKIFLILLIMTLLICSSYAKDDVEINNVEFEIPEKYSGGKLNDDEFEPPSDKSEESPPPSEESPPPSLLRTHRVTFITMGSSKPLSEIVRLYNYLFAK